MAEELQLVPLPPEEAIQYFRGKVAMSPEEFAQLEASVRVQAFTVAGIAALDMLQTLLDLLTRALEEGMTLAEFREAANDELARRGFTGLTPYRADNIFRTNLQSAYQVGRWRQMTRPDVLRRRPYWRYDAVNDNRTRPSHRALDGLVRRADDPFWDVYYPPNGYRCRCSVQSLSEAEVRARGLEVGQGIPDYVEGPDGMARPLEPPDPGFATNPGKAAWQPDLSKYPPDLQEAYRRRQQGALKGGP